MRAGTLDLPHRLDCDVVMRACGAGRAVAVNVGNNMRAEAPRWIAGEGGLS